jgi:AcrR family transcriptional regulator
MNAVESAAARVAAGMDQLKSARPEAMRADARRNYDRLLAAAAAAFAERGSDDVSLEEIARRAGVGIGTLYRHFPTRAALFEAVYREQVEALGARAVTLLGSQPPAGALAEWVRALAEFGITKQGLSRELMADSPFMPACKTVITESSNAMVERARMAGVLRAQVTGIELYRMVHGLVTAVSAGPGDPTLLDRLLAVMLAGLLAEAPA